MTTEAFVFGFERRPVKNRCEYRLLRNKILDELVERYYPVTPHPVPTDSLDGTWTYATQYMQYAYDINSAFRIIGCSGDEE